MYTICFVSGRDVSVLDTSDDTVECYNHVTLCDLVSKSGITIDGLNDGVVHIGSYIECHQSELEYFHTKITLSGYIARFNLDLIVHGKDLKKDDESVDFKITIECSLIDLFTRSYYGLLVCVVKYNNVSYKFHYVIPSELWCALARSIMAKDMDKFVNLFNHYFGSVSKFAKPVFDYDVSLSVDSILSERFVL